VGNCDVSSLPTPSLTYTVTKEDIEIVYIGLVYTYRKDIRRRTYGSPSCPFFCVRSPSALADWSLSLSLSLSLWFYLNVHVHLLYRTCTQHPAL
jgi:hypothetical protein